MHNDGFEAARIAAEVEAATVDNTQHLKQTLQPHRLQRNTWKCESLVSVRGKGASTSARQLFGGDWKGPALKDSMKYLGARLQAQLSCKLEIPKLIAAARSGFAMFANCSGRAKVPHKPKIKVFRAVVNQAFRAALEVRALSNSIPHWTGFVAGWKERLLQTSASSIRAVKGTCGDAFLPQPLVQWKSTAPQEPVHRSTTSSRNARRERFLKMVESSAEVVR